MDSDAIWAFLFIAALVTSIYLRFRRPGQKRVFITDYQCGLRFVDGVFVDKVGPGSYRSNDSKRQITVVDMRPHLIVVERLFYQDALQSPSVISIGAELSVVDAYLATTRLKNLMNDSVSIVRDAIRDTVAKSIIGHSPEARQATTARIEEAARTDLRTFGVTISNIEITEAWSRPVEPRVISGAN